MVTNREESEGRDDREPPSHCERSGTFGPASSRAVSPPDDGEQSDPRAVARFEASGADENREP
ncbi:hypothetical protein [Haloarcula marismortui]|uniref:Uncharacterized protein n=1 Tax=Haloarcula marismortui (strain ATCC 43049 / DSM 3752 / JCM 8966 / VKM B-1809) TaxID=272569 RepID=A0A4P8K050_HALMA|nr:hypothetical protein [Haloarcula marismortui]QCP92722.1 hypothetical protein E6P14_18335 [Haloarcula marismortui ATCC 43049]